ncbi:four helix bundle protein [Roseivirga seohaensis]|uniref:four helix bundle protein n=1 Tax=Roseivirga seohaensis TaxID=1914963 RepID=UPI003BA928F4
MATITRFEDLNIWKEARIQTQGIYAQIINNQNIQDYPLKNQINGSSGSVMDNIAEGYDRKGNKEFKQFLAIALGSNGEVKSQLYRSLDRCYINQKDFDEFIIRNENISKMLTGFIKYLNRTEFKGSKFIIEEPIAEYASTNLEH